MWEQDNKKGWEPKNWCLWTVVLEKTLESPLDSKIKPVNPIGNQPWIFTGRTDAEDEAPILWPPDVKSQLTGKDPDAGKAGGEGDDRDEMIGWHHRLHGHEFEQAQGDGEGQGSLACCSPWGHKESTQLRNWRAKSYILLLTILQCLKTSNIYCQIFYHCHYSFYFIFSLQICPFFSIFFLLVFYFLFTFSPKLENLNYFLHPCSECQLFRLIVIPFPGNCFFGSNCCYCPQRLTWSWEGVAGYSPHHPDAPHTHTHPTCHRPGPGTRSRADRACYSNVTGPGLWLSHAESFTVVYTHWRRGRKVRLTLYGHWAGKIFFKPRTWSNE